MPVSPENNSTPTDAADFDPLSLIPPAEAQPLAPLPNVVFDDDGNAPNGDASERRAPIAADVAADAQAADEGDADARFLRVLKKYWGYDSFRSIQLDIVRSIAAGNDTLGLMPTGGGKSITFQVPALAMDGLCIVVTPLIALMKDQVDNLRRHNIPAAAVFSGQGREEQVKVLDNAAYGAYKFLYVSPERLGTQLFLTKLAYMHVALLTVDEAHCISQWGYDFRPAYLDIAKIRPLLPDVPVLALTATATPEVVEDICTQLQFREGRKEVFRMSFARKNLRYVVRTTQDKTAELLHILRSVPGAAIVYTRSRQGTFDVAKMLESEGITANFYHAGLSDLDKDVRQHAWQDGDVRVMVATNAFGMGIDKSDVRLVVHMDLPDSVEAYFQEAGRAGRDGNTAYAVLLYMPSDHTKMTRRVPETFPEKDYIAGVYDNLANFFQLAVGDGQDVTYEFSIERFCAVFRYFPVQLISALNILTQAGYIDFRPEEDNTSRLLFITRRDDLYSTPLSIEGDKIVGALLRHYAGLFSDYVNIEEDRLAAATNLTQHEVYETLKLLNFQRVIHYIPKKRIPHITYRQRRVERAQIPTAVYELRRDDYVKRIGAILRYATTQDVCRSRMLLEYFGDDSASDCGFCDVCIARKKAETGGSADNMRSAVPMAAQRMGTEATVEMVKEAIVQQLTAADRGLLPQNFHLPTASKQTIHTAFAELLDDEQIVLRDGMIALRDS